MRTEYKTKTLYLVITEEMFQDLKNMSVDIDTEMRNALLKSIDDKNIEVDELNDERYEN